MTNVLLKTRKFPQLILFFLLFYVNTFSQQVGSKTYDGVYFFSENNVKVQLNGKYGIVSKNGKEMTSIEFDEIGDCKEELAPVKKDGKTGFINDKGKLVVALKYTVADPFIKGKSRVGIREDGKLKFGFIDKTGKEIISVKYYPLPHQLGDDFIIVLQDNKYAILDWNEKSIQSAIFSEINIFSDGMARVKIDGKYGFIDQKAQLTIPAKYEDADYFNGGYAKVTLNGESIKINKKGEIQQ